MNHSTNRTLQRRLALLRFMQIDPADGEALRMRVNAEMGVLLGWLGKPPAIE